MSFKIQSADELVAAVAADTQLQEEVKADPVRALSALAAPLTNDKWIYRTVVGALGLALLIALIGGVILATNGKESSTAFNLLTALGSAAVGALAGLLAPAPGRA